MQNQTPKVLSMVLFASDAVVLLCSATVDDTTLEIQAESADDWSTEAYPPLQFSMWKTFSTAMKM